MCDFKTSNKKSQVYYLLSINQNLGNNFDAPKSSYRSEKQPVLSPCIFETTCSFRQMI